MEELEKMAELQAVEIGRLIEEFAHTSAQLGRNAQEIERNLIRLVESRRTFIEKIVEKENEE